MSPITKQLTNRDVRALTEYMTILSNAEMSANTAGLYTVISKTGRSYTVDLKTGACECIAALYHEPAGGCKHLRRVEFAMGRRPIPEWVDESTLDDQLRLDIEYV